VLSCETLTERPSGERDVSFDVLQLHLLTLAFLGLLEMSGVRMQVED
jgi:hypothetical protein